MHLHAIPTQVDKDLRVMLIKPDAPAPRVVGVRVWPRAIPQFNVGHLDQLDIAKASLSKAGWDNFLLGGNYVSGEQCLLARQTTRCCVSLLDLCATTAVILSLVGPDPAPVPD